MKRVIYGIVFFSLTLTTLFAQNAALPRLAVVEFELNTAQQKAKQDASGIRNLVRTKIVETGKYTVITRDEIDKLLANQRIQVSNISNPENIKKLQLTNISFIVTGTVDAMDNDYMVTISLLDVSNGQVSHQTSQLMSNTPSDINNKIPVLVSNFQKGLSDRRTYKAWDTGPAGGIVFYDKGFISDGWRYLEAAPASAEFTAQWGPYGVDVPGTGTAVGNGKRNTQNIVNRLNALGENDYAAQICIVMNINGFNDWFLPSKDELNLMNTNLQKKGMGEFIAHCYWASSQYDNNLSWNQILAGDGYQSPGNGNKLNIYKVRAVRAF